MIYNRICEERRWKMTDHESGLSSASDSLFTQYILCVIGSAVGCLTTQWAPSSTPVTKTNLFSTCWCLERAFRAPFWNDCGWLLLSYAKLYSQSDWAARSRLRRASSLRWLCLVLPSNFGVAVRACWNSVHAGLIRKLSLKRLGEWSVRQLKIDRLLVWNCTSVHGRAVFFIKAQC